ncbi:patatin-like phospholipase family protein [Entomomonas sp. E2T0]|uniref:patatin-like phospholipase family protein n=1 Tax=Entomomonas sp. E2T0 TaxID=2930213 RepID=UPI002228187B|nr:patatin-like phospholipase family protein [Entomomonas sp. E2T0]UYZ82761.1 patatin-like phospholipase family protein [Entomomonas sp. E2T0]
MDYQFKNLVFEGGGVLGTAYLGAAQVLDEKGILKNIERVGGTSAGAIYAVVTGLNYSLAETTEILWKMDFNKFMDSSFGIIRNTNRLLNEFGWYKGDYFLTWIKNIIKQKTGSAETTFAQLEQLKQQHGFRSIYLIGSNLSTGFSEVFSAETTPNMTIAEAVRISMSIPLFFASRKVNNDTYVDGGTQLNYAIKLFDRKKYLTTNNFIETEYYQSLNTSAEGNYQVDYVYNKETLGFKLSSRENIDIFWHKKPPAHTKINDIFDYLKQLVGAVMNVQADVHLHSDDWARSIYIDTLGVSAINFDLTDNNKQQLVESGKQGTLTYFNWFDNK